MEAILTAFTTEMGDLVTTGMTILAACIGFGVTIFGGKWAIKNGFKWFNQLTNR